MGKKEKRKKRREEKREERKRESDMDTRDGNKAEDINTWE